MKFGKVCLPYYISTYPHTAMYLPAQAPLIHAYLYTHLYMQQPVGSQISTENFFKRMNL